MKTRKLTAIKTYYNGYYFNSRLEVKNAFVFDCMRNKYIYEKEGFNLGDGIYYLPDFWFPDHNLWGEVKPEQPTHKEIEKAIRLEEQSGYPVLFFIGQPDIDTWFHKFFQREKSGFREVLCKEWWNDENPDWNVLGAIHKVKKIHWEKHVKPPGQKSFPFFDDE